jgi:MinD-like ATPase involved in chromosome partitioning or flagellar assembly
MRRPLRHRLGRLQHLLFTRLIGQLGKGLVLRGGRSGPGITDLVRGNASFGQIITRDRDSRLHIVPAGRIDMDSGEILVSERLQIALTALARAYDHVVIDAGAMSGPGQQPIARIGQRAVLVATGAAREVVEAAGNQLIASGFTDVTVFTGEPPQPRSHHYGAQVAA